MARDGIGINYRFSRGKQSMVRVTAIPLHIRNTKFLSSLPATSLANVRALPPT